MPKADEIKFRCDAEFKLRVKEAAKQSHRSMANFVTKIVTDHLDAEEQRLGLVRQARHADKPKPRRPARQTRN